MNGSSTPDDREAGALVGPIDLVRDRSPLLTALAAEYRNGRPLCGTTIAVSAPVTPHTGLFVETLTDAGADVRLSGESGSTHDEVVAALEGNDGVEVFAEEGMDESALRTARRTVLESEPDLIADDGGYLIELVHEAYPDIAAEVLGACEQTTGGIRTVRAIDDGNGLAFPVYDVNGTPVKQRLDNVHGTAESTLSAIASVTNAMIAGSTWAVVGFGRCGRGIARKLHALGARTIVTEIDPRPALDAAVEGHDVRPLNDAVARAKFVLTVTGSADVLGREQFDRMGDRTVLASAGSEREIDTDALAGMAVSVESIAPGIDRYVLEDGRGIDLLAAGEVVNLAAPNRAGNPAEVMDVTFAAMAGGLRELLERAGELESGIHPLPDRIDRTIAAEKLRTMGVELDEQDE